jgi:hypothetical protein
MDDPIFNNDVYRLIILSSSVLEFPKLSSVNKYFNVICNDKNTWSTIFNNKGLLILDDNDNINTIKQYIEEYQKMSYASYTANGLYTMMDIFKCSNHSLDKMCGVQFTNLTYIHKILKMDIYERLPNFKYFNINIVMGNNGKIYYYTKIAGLMFLDEMFRWGQDAFGGIEEIYDDKSTVISLITKILYYYPNINILDSNYRRLVIKDEEKTIMEQSSYETMNKRKNYWIAYHEKYHDNYY